MVCACISYYFSHSRAFDDFPLSSLNAELLGPGPASQAWSIFGRCMDSAPIPSFLKHVTLNCCPPYPDSLFSTKYDFAFTCSRVAKIDS